MQGRIVHGDNLPILESIASESIDLIYIDPPFNTGQKRRRVSSKAVRDESSNRLGFGGKKYRTVRLGQSEYRDSFDDYIAFLRPRMVEAHRILKMTGSLYFHVDYREVHYCKVMLDEVFGRHCFLNEIIWAYDYGGKTTKRWPPKHDNILVYVKDNERYYFDAESVDRIPYMAPKMAGEEKAESGKLPTDTWWHTIVSPTGKEKTGYPTQKPIGILKRIVQASCPKDGIVLDFFAGSGTTGAAAAELGRNFILIDSNEDAIAVMKRRFKGIADVVFEPC